MTWAENLYRFYSTLEPPENIPAGIEWLYPQKDLEVMKVVEKFLHKYYNDESPRTLMFGINPGRFGAGVTGVNFTAPRQLFEQCGIAHQFKNQSELSAEFIYEMINRYGGPEKFYIKYFIGSVCPLGFIKNGRNINYYDDKDLLATVEPFIISTISQQVSFHANRKKAFSIGGEKNYKYLSKLNHRFNWFEEIIPLAHPRFIMQYRRKTKDVFIKDYLSKLQ
jgi:hypothetical protein